MTSYIYIVVLYDFKHVQLGHTSSFFKLMNILNEYYSSYGTNLDYYEYKVIDHENIINNFKKQFEKYKLYHNIYKILKLNDYLNFLLQ